MKPEKDNTDQTASGQRQDLAKIQVEGQQDSPFGGCFVKNLAVGETLKPLLTQVNGVVTFGPEPLRNSESNPHVREEAHPLPSGDVHLLLRKPGCVLQRLSDILGL